MARGVAGSILALSILVSGMTARAQDGEREAPPTEATPTEATPTEATPAGVVTPEVRVLRPPEGSWRRGRFPVPDWAVYVSGGTLAVLAAGALLTRARRRGRAARRQARSERP